MTTGHAFARAAIAGNPSDGFDGAVCSVIVPMLSATATIGPEGVGNGDNSADGGPTDGDGLRALVSAARSRFSAEVQPVDAGIAIDTTIPRSVGLAGSSAIVVACLRALAAHVSVELSGMELAEMAHTVERVDLSIAGGWQDQLVQSHGRSALVECAAPRRVEPIDMPTDPPIPLYLAWSETAAEASGQAHSSLQSERSASDPEMRSLAELGRRAATSFATRDVHTLKEAIDATFDIRRTIMDIVPQQVAMIDTARALGACANFAGSGGAIVGVLPKSGQLFLDGLVAAGYRVLQWDAQ